jgi:hypothetical protein
VRRISVLAAGAALGITAALAMTAAGAVGGASALVSGGATAPEFVSSGDCAREKPLVRRALDRSSLRVDVDGDGRLDKVAVATDSEARKRCRVLVGVHVRGGSTYSAHLQPPMVTPKGLRARITHLPDLGNDPGAEIVVDTRVKADSLLAQMLTLTADGLRFVPMPAFEDGTFVVEGGGVSFPRGASCNDNGAMILSMATLLDNGRYQVTRHTYPVRGDRLRLTGPRMRVATVPGDRLADRFPEFVRPHFKECTGRVRR